MPSHKEYARPQAWASVPLSHSLGRCGLGEVGRDRSPETGQSLPKVDQQGAEVVKMPCEGLMRAKRSQGLC